MEITPEILSENLYRLLTTKIANRRFYEKRSLGFRNEIEFEHILKEREYETLDPGQFLLLNRKTNPNSQNSMIYVTVSKDDKSSYEKFYSMLGKLEDLKRFFFVEICDTDEWVDENFVIKDERGMKVNSMLIRPKLDVFEFVEGEWSESSLEEIRKFFPESRQTTCAKKPNNFGYLTAYELDDLIPVYCNRYFLDITLAGVSKGMMDFDHIIIKDGKFIPVETKEKSPIKDSDDEKDWAFGWDSRRFGWYFYLRHKLDLNSWYVIREVKDKDDREFMKWKIVDFDGFCRSVSWLAERSAGGGAGTIEAPYSAFTDF